MFKRLVKNLAGIRPDPASESIGLVERAAIAHRQGARAEARALYLQALSMDAGNPDALHLLGVLEYQERRYDQAIEFMEEAIALQPASADFHMNCANAYLARGQTAESIASLRTALRLRPAFRKAHANLLFALSFSGELPEAILEEHRNWYSVNILPALEHLPPPANSVDAARRLRIGYVSADFREHVVARFIEPLFVHHDRDAFELFAYDGGDAGGAVNARLRAHVENWRMIRTMSDDQAAETIRGDGIDILVDLAGHTLGGRLAMFAGKPAPIQVSYLGYPGTTGLPEMDYRITDAICDPPGLTDAHYTERLMRLPDCLVCYVPPADIAESVVPPALACGHVTFGSFNQPAKLGPAVLALWANVLRSVDDSRLLLAQMPEGATRERYLGQFASLGVSAERIEFAPRLPMLEYQALRARVDIALDSYPMNGGSTTCETLWMGVPLVTLAGDRYVSRVGASMLTAVGLREFIAHDPAGYVEIATSLAGDFARLGRIRATLRDRMRASPLMDGGRLSRNIEALYRQMWRDWCRTRTTA